MDRGEPDFVNDKGVKWWLDKSTTDYAKEENITGVSLKDVRAFIVQEESGRETRLLLQGSNIIYESQKLEEIGVRIDKMKLEKSFSQ